MVRGAPQRWPRLVQAGQVPLARSAAFLALLAFHTQGRPGKGLQPGFPYRLAARFAYPICTLFDPGQRPLGLHEKFAGVVSEGKLMLTLVGFRTDIRLIIPGVTDRITEALGYVRLCPLDVGA